MSLFLQKTQSELQMGIAPLDLQTLYSQLDKIASLIRLLEPFGIKELVRTGLTAMDRGSKLLGMDL